MNPTTGLFAAYIFADMATDAMMMNSMRSNGYHVGAPVVYQRGYGGTIMAFIILIVLLAVAGGVVMVISKDS